MTSFVLFSLFLIVSVASVTPDEFQVVQTKSGSVRGIRQTTFLKKVDFYSFRGIPYAKPPTGELRFKAPEPIEPWTPRVHDAFEYGSTCIHPNELFNIADNYPQSEDCLFLNIFVPADIKSNEKLPVMFWIHGGAFRDWSGNDNLFGADFLIEQRVIFVTFNYRLGVFGFLSLGTQEYSGNMGLKDQQLALKWICSNIERFNGDVKRITIFGQSAGGSSTHLQVLSIESQKYFKNAIAMSGASENYFTFLREDNIISLAYKIAKDLNKPHSSIEDLIKFYQNVPSKDIVNSSISVGTLNFSPIVEKSDAKKPFITKTPIEIYKSSNINKDMIFYHTSSELNVVFEAQQMADAFWEANKEALTIFFPFQFNYPPGSKEYMEFNNAVRKFYFGSAEINRKVKTQYLDMMNDIFFVYGIHKAMKFHTKYATGNAYYFQFSVNSTLNLLKRHSQLAQLPESSHCDEYCYLFRGTECNKYYDEILSDKNSKDTKICLQTIDYMTTLFANFAKFGNSALDLFADQSIQNNDTMVLDINNDGLKAISDPKRKSMEFWTDLDAKAQTINKN